MSIGYNGAMEVVEVKPEFEEYIELDDITDSNSLIKVEDGPSMDPFDNIPIKGMETNLRKRANRLNKKLENVAATAGSKYIDLEFISGYALYDLVRPPYELDSLAKLYEEHPVHNAACNAKAINTVGLGFNWQQTNKTKKKIERVSGDEDKHRNLMDKIHNEVERLDDIFDEFNRDETFTEVMTKACIDMHATGNGYIEVGRTVTGDIGYIGHVPSYVLRIRRARDGFIQIAYNNSNRAVFFRNFQDHNTPDPINGDVSPNELIHLKLYTPTDNYYGVPNIVSALPSLVGDKFAKEYNIDYFENKAIPRYALVIKGAKLSDKSKRELIQYFKNEVRGKNHGTLIIPLPATMGQQVDVKFEKLESGVQDGSFDKYRKANRDDIVIAHRIPPTKIGISDGANLAVARDADKTFKEQLVGPDQIRFEKRINQIVREFTDIIEFKFNQLDIIDADMKSRIHDRYLRAEVLDPNEVRDEIGRPARKGGSEVLPFPTNVQQDKNQSDQQHQKKQFGLQQDQFEHDKANPEPAPVIGGKPGAPTGNTNNPAKAGPETPKDQIGTRNEKGESQDKEGVRERSEK